MKKLYSICLICLCVCMFLIMGVFAEATTIEEILGERTTMAMLDEIATEINRYSTITTEQIHEIINDITNTYGLELTAEQFKELYNEVLLKVEAKITDNISIWDQLKMFVQRIYDFVEDTFPSVKNQEVTITVPRISQVDSLVNQGIYYFIREILPLITT